MISIAGSKISYITAFGNKISDVYYGPAHVWPELPQGELIEKILSTASENWKWANDDAQWRNAPRFTVETNGPTNPIVRGTALRPVMGGAVDKASLKLSSGEVKTNADVMITATCPGEQMTSSNYVYRDVNFSFGMAGIVSAKISGTKATIVEENGSRSTDVTIPTFATGSNWGELRLRVVSGVAKLYHNETKIAEKRLSVKLPKTTKIVISVARSSLTVTGFFVKTYTSAGGPMMKNICIYTGLESKNRAKIWGMQN